MSPNLPSSLKKLHHGAWWLIMQCNFAGLSEPTCTITSQIRPTAQVLELYIFPLPSIVTPVNYFRAQSHRSKRWNYFQEQRFASHNAFKTHKLASSSRTLNMLSISIMNVRIAYCLCRHYFHAVQLHIDLMT